jgi:hypothetical protein
MPLICVWTADCQSPDDASPTVRANSQRCLVHTDAIVYATEATVGLTGEVYVVAYLSNNTVVNIFEQTLDTLVVLSQPEDKPNA